MCSAVLYLVYGYPGVEAFFGQKRCPGSTIVLPAYHRLRAFVPLGSRDNLVGLIFFLNEVNKKLRLFISLRRFCEQRRDGSVECHVFWGFPRLVGHLHRGTEIQKQRHQRAKAAPRGDVQRSIVVLVASSHF